MGFFSNSDKSHQNTRSNTSTTIITAGTQIRGEVTLSCNFYVDGHLEGNITSENEIFVGKNGYIKGDISADKVIVQGLTEGSINAKRLEIRPEGKVIGSVESEELVIEAKGVFEGNSLLRKSLKEPLVKDEHDLESQENFLLHDIKDD